MELKRENLKKLFFDTAITGHHTEYISYIIDYLLTLKKDDEYIFVVNPEFSKKFPGIYDKSKKLNKCIWQQITNKEFNKTKGKSRVKSDLREFKILKKYAGKFAADHVYILNLNAVIYGTVFYRTKFKLSGILFSHFYRLNKNSVNEKVFFYKRYLPIKLLKLNKKVKSVFILNDEETVKFMNNKFSTKIFKVLPDPIPKLNPMENFNIYKHYNIDENKKIFLHIGALGNRKGTFEIIEAAIQVSSSVKNNVVILLVGKASTNADKETMISLISKVKQKNSAQLIWDEQFVPLDMMKSLFDQCYAVLIPYKNVEFSSGILGHAAAAGKMVIATGDGLIRELVINNNLGILIESPKPENISKAIVESLDSAIQVSSNSNFVKQHSPEIFAERILEH